LLRNKGHGNFSQSIAIEQELSEDFGKKKKSVSIRSSLSGILPQEQIVGHSFEMFQSQFGLFLFFLKKAPNVRKEK
jgi:hypothetical protein